MGAQAPNRPRCPSGLWSGPGASPPPAPCARPSLVLLGKPVAPACAGAAARLLADSGSPQEHYAFRLRGSELAERGGGALRRRRVWLTPRVWPPTLLSDYREAARPHPEPGVPGGGDALPVPGTQVARPPRHLAGPRAASGCPAAPGRRLRSTHCARPCAGCGGAGLGTQEQPSRGQGGAGGQPLGPGRALGPQEVSLLSCPPPQERSGAD